MTHSAPLQGWFDARPGGTLELKRPLSVFGKRFEVQLSTAYTLSPATILRAVLGDEQLSPRQLKSRVSTVKAIQASQSGVRPATARTRSLLRQSASPLIRPEHVDLVVDAVLNGVAPRVPVPPRSLWEIPDLHEDLALHSVCNLMASIDWACRKCQELDAACRHVERDELALKTLGNPPAAWRAINPKIDWFPTLALDSALIALARLGYFFSHTAREPSASEPQVQHLLREGRTPIGHWLLEVQVSARRSSLPDLVSWLDSHGVVIGARQMTESDLKKWSAGTRLMRPDVMRTIVQPIATPSTRARLARRFYLAQLLMFLCDLARACIESDPAPSWSEVQGQILRRYEQIWAFENAVGPT